MALLGAACGATRPARTADPIAATAAAQPEAARPFSAGAKRACARPRLIVQVTVDQLRADLLARNLDRFGEGGVRRLWHEGVRYAAANYRYATTETAPGHATLATGADPSVHGIVANDWVDAGSGEPVYSLFDADSPLLGVEEGAYQGRSPAALQASTFADELWLASAGASRIYGVSVKDRGAMLLAGRKGQAFWYDKATGRFITSRHYAAQLPDWVTRFNASQPWQPYVDQAWDLLRPRERYVHGAHDDRDYEQGHAGWGATFPHAYGNPESDAEFFTRLSSSPAGDELTLAFVRALFEHEALGTRPDQTDFLAVSFSSTDYVGHYWGPSSLESEDNLLRLDRTLAELLSWIDERVGLAHTLVVLSADHGAGEAPQQRAAQGFEAARYDLQQGNFEAVSRWVAQRTGQKENLVRTARFPYVWLDTQAARRAGLSPAEARALLAEAFAAQPGVHRAFTRDQLEDAARAEERLLRQARRSYHPQRSGDVHLVPEPFSLLSLTPGDSHLTASHGSPWRYDTHVPILVLDPELAPGVVTRAVGPHAIAPTLAERAGVAPPSGAQGELLGELLQCAASHKPVAAADAP